MSAISSKLDQRRAWTAEVREYSGQGVFDYYEKRSKGLIPQNEQVGWGYEQHYRRDMTRDCNDALVKQALFDVEWNKGYTGRGGMSVSSFL